MSVTTVSGQPVYAVCKLERGKPRIRTGKSSEPGRTPRLGADERGTVFEAEPVLGPDGLHVELNWVFLHREGDGANARRLESASSIGLGDNATAVLASWPKQATLPANPKDILEHIALVLHIDCINDQGVPIRKAVLDRMREASKAAREGRQSR